RRSDARWPTRGDTSTPSPRASSSVATSEGSPSWSTAAPTAARHGTRSTTRRGAASPEGLPDAACGAGRMWRSASGRGAAARDSMRPADYCGFVSVMNRDRILDRMTERRAPYDLVIVGGGATGVGIAVDAVSRGYDVALVEQS